MDDPSAWLWLHVRALDQVSLFSVPFDVPYCDLCPVMSAGSADLFFERVLIPASALRAMTRLGKALSVPLLTTKALLR